jgi:ATP:corrinoid adenosyltransferase
MQENPEGAVLIVTGRMADTRVIEAADLLTEMKGIKQAISESLNC